MKAADEATFNKILVPSLAIMESAGRAVLNFILSHCASYLNKKILIVVGSGNNGGDGLVLARNLLNFNLKTKVLLTKEPSFLKAEARDCCDSFLKSNGDWEVVKDLTSLEKILKSGEYSLIVDAIFGTGFKGKPEGLIEAVIKLLNKYSKKKEIPILAIDLPSGICSDSAVVLGEAISATYTLALQCLKPAHLLYPATEYSGDLFCADIGIANYLPEIKDIKRELIEEGFVSDLLKNNKAFSANSHKGRRGHLVVFGGSEGKFGAAKLSAETALKSGAGLVTLAFFEKDASKLSPKLKELMCVGVKAEKDNILKTLKNKDAVVIGPGFGTSDAAQNLLKIVLEVSAELNLPIVIDADAINILSANPAWQKSLPKKAVFTPHPAEMARLISSTVSAVQENRLEVAEEMAKKLNSVVILKGARTIICREEHGIFINPTATAVLGTAGTGDVLSGIIGAFMSQGFETLPASIIAVYIHGLAAEFLEQKLGPYGILASDIGKQVPLVLNQQLKKKTDSLGIIKSIG